MSTVQGEYWIDPDSGCGSTYADGDIGDEGHEAIAFRSALSLDSDEYEEHFNAGHINWDALAEKYIEANDLEISIDDVKAMSAAEWRDFAKKNSFDQKVIDAYADKPDDREVALGYQIMIDDGGDREFIDYILTVKHADARLWAVEKMGWIRVKGDNYEVWEFDDKALKCIQNFDGLEDALMDDENTFEEGGEYEDAEAYIEERSTGKMYEIKYRDLLKAKTAAGLKNYKEGIGKWR